MTTNPFSAETIFTPALAKRMLLGASIGLILIAAFLISAGEGKAEWGKVWMIKPLMMMPFAGSMGGAFYHLMDFLRVQGGRKKIAANAVSLIVFVIGLWMGFVLGLNGTYWN